jgi:protease-4
VKGRRATNLGRDRGQEYVGVVRVHGAISQESSFGGSGSGATEESVIGAVRAARESKKVRGVLLHIDSPGGSALASARMHRELELLAAEKPLVAVMANVAASGGYYVAAAAHAIVAEPVTITGSIGVIAVRFAVHPILERLGVNVDVLKRGARSDLFDPTHLLPPDDRAAVEREIASTYREFVEVVARGRHKSVDEVLELAQGRVWTGKDAHARGLVDVLGGFEVALADVKQRIGKGSDRLLVREVRGNTKEWPTLAAEPAKAKKALVHAANELLGEWGELLPLVLGTERVLLWTPEAMGYRGK